jgi:hypothetical protein
MSEQQVDLGAIRGDWEFHARYVTNSLEQTLKRLHKNWRGLKKQSIAAGVVPMAGELMDEFIEACRQTRALCDDVILMRQTQPAKSKAHKAARRPAARKARSRSSK